MKLRLIDYVKAAFFLRINFPMLGALPVNILALLGLTMLGFGHPGFWFLGLGLEPVYLLALATNPRFQRLTQALRMNTAEQDYSARWAEIVAHLSRAEQDRLHQLQARCDRVLAQQLRAGVPASLVDGNRDALRQLSLLYLKLLVAQNNLCSLDKNTSEAELQKTIRSLKEELQDESLPSTLRDSREATLRIQEQRLDNYKRMEGSMKEISSDLARIDAQVDLALEQATLSGQPQAISANIDLYSQLLDGSLFGTSAQAVAMLDESLREN
jgi:hypothetical protein